MLILNVLVTCWLLLLAYQQSFQRCLHAPHEIDQGSIPFMPIERNEKKSVSFIAGEKSCRIRSSRISSRNATRPNAVPEKEKKGKQGLGKRRTLKL